MSGTTPRLRLALLIGVTGCLNHVAADAEHVVRTQFQTYIEHSALLTGRIPRAAGFAAQTCVNQPRTDERTEQFMNSIRQHTCSRAALSVIGALLFAAGCTTTTTQSFNVGKNTEVEASYIAVDADFSRYDRIFARDMGIYFPSDAAPSLEDQQRTRQIFQEAFIKELAGYIIVREAEPTALEVQATLIDYRNAAGAQLPQVRRELADIARPGALLFLMELKDPASGKILARAADSASAPSFSTSADAKTDWESVEAAAARWAGLFRRFVDQNLKQ